MLPRQEDEQRAPSTAEKSYDSCAVPRIINTSPLKSEDKLNSRWGKESETERVQFPKCLKEGLGFRSLGRELRELNEEQKSENRRTAR